MESILQNWKVFEMSGKFVEQTWKIGIPFFAYRPRLLIFAVLLRKNADFNMKKGIHPEYREVVFWDTSSDTKFLSRSTSHTKETVKWEDGKEYPVIKVEVSSASHPFFTGKKMFVDTAGRVEKFKNKYQKKA